MTVRKVIGYRNAGVPDYFSLYMRWSLQAQKTGDNHARMESMRMARLAEEFGQAVIEEDDITLEDFLLPHVTDRL